MSNWYNKKWLSKTKLPTTGSQNSTLNLVLFKQSVLDKIAGMCLPSAGGSEFQVHYRGIQIIIYKEDLDSRLVFTIPTVFFNMPQTVTTASVIYNLDEISEISAKLKPASDIQAASILASFPTTFFENLGFKVSAREAEMGSLHRHPGNFGFSSTDMDNKANNPGVIFRRLNCTDLIQVDSVMYIPSKKVSLVTTETRVITVEQDGDGIKGEYLAAPTAVYITQDAEIAKENFDIFLGETLIDKEAEDFDIEVKTKWINNLNENFMEIYKVFIENADYQPIIEVDPSLIKTHSYTHYGRGNSYYKNKRQPSHYYDDYYDEYYDDDTQYITQSSGYKKQVTPPRSAEDVRVEGRPAWRKTQTINLLKTWGVDIDQFPTIDGSGSNNDIILTITALKLLNYGNDKIGEFLTQTG